MHTGAVTDDEAAPGPEPSSGASDQRRERDDRVGTALLDVAAGVPNAANAFAQLVYPFICAYVLKQRDTLRRHAAQLIGADVFADVVPDGEPGTLASDVARTACERLISSASRFDPARGTAMGWVMRATTLAYLSEAQRLRGRSKLQIDLTDDVATLVDLDSRRRDSADPLDTVLAREEFTTVLGGLDDAARDIWLLVHRYGLSREAIAEKRYAHLGDAALRQVDSHIRRASRQLAAAGERYRAASEDREKVTGQ